MGFDFSYTYIVFIFTLGFIIFVLLYQWKYKLGLKKVPAAVIVEKNCFKIIVMTGLALVIAAFINIFVLFPIFKNIFFTSKDNFVVSDIYVRSFKYLFSHSARPLSYLLPASSHPLFGKITESMFGSLLYGRNSIEHTLYLGWLPLLLSFFTFQQWKKKRLTAVRQNGPDKKADFIIGFLIFSAILAFIFSMPPYINLGIFKIYLPSFFMYKIIPVYRAYARFGFLMLFAISILAGFGLNYILLRFKKFKIKFLFSSLIILGILFEFINIPPFRVTDLSKPPKVYQWVSQQKGDFAIAEYPLGQTSLGEGFIPLNYLFWQRVHQKKLINGARMGTNAYKVKRKIHKITDKNVASYLAWLGVKYVIMHLDVYRDGTDQEAVDIIGEIPDLRKRQGFKLINKFDSEEVYEVTAKSIEVKFDDN